MISPLPSSNDHAVALAGADISEGYIHFVRCGAGRGGVGRSGRHDIYADDHAHEHCVFSDLPSKMELDFQSWHPLVPA